MSTTEFQRARSADAKQQRERAILDAARALGTANGIRQVTLTDIAGAVGMHKSAMLRYFETREQIFLALTAQCWREWAPAVRAELARLTEARDATPASVASLIAGSLVARPLFCDLLAQAPLNLERHASVDAVRSFKLVTLEEFDALQRALRQALLGLSERDARDALAAAVALVGAFWQMATPPPEIGELYVSEPQLAHAVVDVEPRVAHTLEAMLRGFLGGDQTSIVGGP